MNAMLSNLSHDLDVSLAYIIDKKVGGDRTGISALVSGLNSTARPRPWPPILPCGQGRFRYSESDATVLARTMTVRILPFRASMRRELRLADSRDILT
jgi:hypothetical protein